MAVIVSIETLGLLLLVGLVGVLLGAVVVMIKRRPKQNPIAPPAPVAKEVSVRSEIQHYFLMNEAGNVLISTTSACGQLPEATVAQFTEALAHLSAVFYSIVRGKDPKNGQHLSLYNYNVIKKTLAQHPVFICTSSEKPERSSALSDHSLRLFTAPMKPKEHTPEEKKKLLEDRVNCSRKALRMGDSQVGQHRLNAIHAQIFAEADRLRKVHKPLQGVGLRMKYVANIIGHPTTPDSLSTLQHEEIPSDDVEIGHLMLYCECLLGVSLVSLKLLHAHYEDYLNSGSLEKMESDTYLFASPAQLRKTMHELKAHG